MHAVFFKKTSYLRWQALPADKDLARDSTALDGLWPIVHVMIGQLVFLDLAATVCLSLVSGKLFPILSRRKSPESRRCWPARRSRLCEIQLRSTTSLFLLAKVDKESRTSCVFFILSLQNVLSDPNTLCSEPGPSLKNISAWYCALHQRQVAKRIISLYPHSKIASWTGFIYLP